MRDTKNVVGHVGSARSTMVSVPSSGSVRPSTICRVGPTPATMFIRTAVTVVSPTVVKWVENPPPGKYSWVAEWKVVTALAAAIIGLGLNEGAYLAEITRSGLESVDVGQTEAAKALGMKPSLIMRRAIIPQAMRVIIPPPGNETIGMLKTTSLVLALPFTLDLQYATSAIANCTYAPIPLLVVAACWYLVMTSVLMIGQHFLEQYFGRGFNGRSSSKRLRRQAAIQAAGTTYKNIALEVEQ